MVVVLELYEARLVGLKLFFRVEVVRVVLHIESSGLVAEVDALLQLVLDHIHLGDDSLDAY